MGTSSSKPLVISAALVAAPIVWYGIKLVVWFRGQRKLLNTLKDEFRGPKPHWLYGNLHQV